jgi:NhaA family Na+:H+ antiporter
LNLTDTFVRFAKSEAFGGFLLITCAIVSLVLANGPFGAEYVGFWHVELGPLSVEHWINDALMAVFFLLIGLELERELYVGELSDFRGALLPLIAAVGGMVAPGLIHFAFNAGEPTQRGFGIPMATDIAFALAVLALLKGRIPPALKVLVVAFAVVDDLGAIVIIAAVYTSELSFGYLALALGVWTLLIALNRAFRIMALAPYLIGGCVMWYALLQAGVHASIAGVLLAFAIPFTSRAAGGPSPSHRLEHWLHKPVAFGVLPLFALANTCVVVGTAAVGNLASANSAGIALGLLVGKTLGISLACALAIVLRLCRLPEGVLWTHVVGAGLLGGIGFTMSIFITNLAFAGDAALIDASKLVVLGASTLSGLLALGWLASPWCRQGPVSS